MNATQKANRRARAAGGYVTLPTVKPSRVAESFYRRAMTAEIERMLASMQAQIKRAYTTIPVQNAPETPAQRLARLRKILERLRKQYGDKLNRNAERIVKKYIQKARDEMNGNARKQYSKEFGTAFTIQFDGQKYGRILKIRATTNAELIRNTTSQIVSNVTNITYDGVTNGQSWRAVEKTLATQKHIARDRIKRIARDQTAKLNESLNQLQQEDAGVKFFEWSTANDERVSTGYGGHKQLEGKIYKWGDTANYPIIDSYGHRGLPAQRVNCRCTALPVILRKDYTARQTADGDWIITNGRL